MQVKELSSIYTAEEDPGIPESGAAQEPSPKFSVPPPNAVALRLIPPPPPSPLPQFGSVRSSIRPGFGLLTARNADFGLVKVMWWMRKYWSAAPSMPGIVPLAVDVRI